MKRFKELTSAPGPNNERPVLIMGRLTAKSLPQLSGPNISPKKYINQGLNPILPGRDILIVTRIEGNNCYPTLSDAIRAAGLYPRPIWICGGKAIYEEALSKFSDQMNIYVTHIPGNYNCDVTCPILLDFIN